MVVEVETILENLDGMIVNNLVKNGEALTFSLPAKGQVHDYSIYFSGIEENHVKFLAEDTTTSEKWEGSLRSKESNAADIYTAIESTFKSLPPDLLKALTESNSNIHFSIGPSAARLQQVSVTGRLDRGVIHFDINMDKLFRGFMSLFNGMISNSKSIEVPLEK